MKYRLIKNIDNPDRTLIIPKGTIFEGPDGNGCYMQLPGQNPPSVYIKHTLEGVVIEDNPEWFEPVFTWEAYPDGDTEEHPITGLEGIYDSGIEEGKRRAIKDIVKQILHFTENLQKSL